jgi:hypothetical protein
MKNLIRRSCYTKFLFQTPCGGRFLDELGQTFGVSSYDLEEIVVLARN